MQSQGEQTRYQCDAFGRRILKASEGRQTRFNWLGDSLIKEQHTSAALGAQSTTYLFEPEQGNSESFKPVALVKSDAENPQGEIYHIHTDHLGTPQEVSNEAGEVVWAAQYRAYGAVKRQLKVAGSDVIVERQPDPSLTMNLRFMGQYFDQETGLHYNRHRYYDPECGQFTTQDPIGLMGGLNNYQYVTNPVSWVDPLGLCEEYGISSGANSAPEFVWHATANPRAAQGVLNGIDPAYLNPNSRFGAAFYVAEQPGTTIAELAHHGVDATHGIRFEMNANVMKVLDLTNPEVAGAWGYQCGPISSVTQKIGVQAQEQGFNVVRFYSERANGGINNAILDNFNEILRPVTVTPVTP